MLSLFEANSSMVKKLGGWAETIARASLEAMGEGDGEGLES